MPHAPPTVHTIRFACSKRSWLSAEMAKSGCDDYGPMALMALMALMAAPWVLGHSTDVQLKASNCPASALRGSASSIIVAADVAEPGASTSTHWPQVHRVHRVIVGTMIVMFMVESPRPRPWDDGYGVVLSKHCWIHPIRAPSERKATPQRA